MRIYGKLIIALLSFIVIPVSFISYFSFYVSKNSLTKEIFSKLDVIADEEAEEIGAFYTERKDDLLILSRHDIYKTTFPALGQFYQDSSNPAYVEAKKEIDRRFSTFKSSHSYLDIMLTNAAGRVIYALSPDHQFLLGTFVSGKGEALEVVKDRFFLTRGACDDAGKVIGLVRAELNMSDFYELLDNAPTGGNSGEILLVKKTLDNKVQFLSPLKDDPNGLSKRTIPIGGPLALPAQKAAMGESGSGLSMDYRGKEVLSVWRPIPLLGWGMVVKIDQEEAYRPIDRLKKILFVVFFIVIVSALSAAFAIAKSISDPIRELSRGAKIIGGGNLEHKMGLNTKDEVGELSRAFDDMTEHLKTSTTSVEVLNKEIRQKAIIQSDLDASLKEALKSREVLSSMLADNNQVRAELGQHIEKLKKSENTSRLILESAADAFVGMDRKGVITGWNSQAERMFGWARTEAIGRKLAETIVPDQHREGHNKGLERFLSSGQGPFLNKWIDITAIHRDGHEFPVALIIWPVGAGEEVTFNAFIHDITNRKKMEEEIRKKALELEESEKRFMDVIYASSDATLIIDGERFVDCNQATVQMLGHSNKADFLMTHPSELSPPTQPDGQPSFEKANEMMKLAGEKGFHRFEWMHKKADQAVFPVEVSLTPITLKGKSVIYCHWRDNTARKIAQDQMRLLSAIAEQNPASVVVTDTQGTIQYVNATFEKVSGYTRQEAIGKNPRILKSGDTPPEVYKALWETITGGGEWKDELHNKRKDGSLYWEFTRIGPIRDAANKITHYLAVKEDITEQKALAAQLRDIQKMETVGRLAGGIAHDFNNLLTVINGYAMMAAESLTADNPLCADIEEISKAGKRAQDLTGQLLAFSRRQPVKPVPTDLGALLAGLDGMLRPLMGEDVEIKIIADDSLKRINADPGQIEQIVANLAVNARDAMSAKGKILFQATNITLDLTEVKSYPGLMPGEYVKLSVIDTGGGMTEDVKSHLFEPFFTTKPKGKGTGLGLATSYGMIKQMGGHIIVRSELGKGSVFEIFLPAIQETLEAREKDAEKEKEKEKERVVYAQRSETILLVEDESMVRHFCEKILIEQGYTLFVAENGAEAVRLFDELRMKNIHVDFLLADVIMPQMGGTELAERLKKIQPDLKVLFMSGYTGDAFGSLGVLDAQTELLKKPFSPEALLDKINGMLG